MNELNAASDAGEQGLTQREAAAKLGKSVGWVNRKISDGFIQLLPNGRVDPAGLTKTVPSRPSSSGPAVSAAGKTSAASRAERDAIAAKMLGLDYAERVGAVTATSEVEAAQTTIARAFRDGLLALPAQLAPSLINMTDARPIEHALRRAFTTFLSGQVDALHDESPPA